MMEPGNQVNYGGNQSGNNYDNSFNISNSGSGSYSQYNNQGYVYNYYVSRNQGQGGGNYGGYSDQGGQQNNSGQGRGNRLCLQVWEVMYKSPSFSLADWEQLANLLGMNTPLGTRFFHFLFRYKKKKYIKNQLEKIDISWKEFKNYLHRMKKDNVIVELCRKTNLTEGLDTLIQQHKDSIRKEMSQRTTHEQYVDLVVVKSEFVDRRWEKEVDDKTFHMMKFTIPQSHFEKISMKDLVSNSKKVTMINGIPGIGKTSLCDEIKYRWSNNQLWNGEIDLLLAIPCRMLNMHNFFSTEELIKHLLPDSQDVDFELLKEISDRILLLMDGADEFQDIEKLSANPPQPNLQFFKGVIDQPKQQLFSKLIITSRPKVAAFLRKFYQDELKCAVRPVEVCGFNDENIKSFVQKQFQDEAVADTVNRKVNETSTMQAMCSVPIFLKSFCTVFQEDSQIKTPSNMTELLLYTLLTFFRELYKLNGNPQMKDLSLKELSTHEDVVKQIFNLSLISHKTLAERKVVFYEEDFGCEMLNELEKIGFLSKRTHVVEGFVYEYKHLVLHEILAALRILSIQPESKREHYDNPNFRDTLPLVSGLEGILNRSDVPKYLKTLVKNVTKFDLVESHHVKSFLEEQLMDKVDQGLFQNTYLFSQSEYMEIPSEEFIDRVLSQPAVLFDLLNRTVVRSRSIKFLSFLLPHVQYFNSMYLTIHSSDDVQQLVDISRKVKELDLFFDEDNHEKWMEYFKRLSPEGLRVERLSTFGSLKPVEINEEDFHFLCGIKEIIIHNGLFLLEVLEKCFNAENEMDFEQLVISIELEEKFHGIGKLFKYVTSLSIFVRYDFTVAQREHIINELKKVKDEKERNLKVIRLFKNGNFDEDVIVDFINSLNFVSDVIRVSSNIYITI